MEGEREKEKEKERESICMCVCIHGFMCGVCIFVDVCMCVYEGVERERGAKNKRNMYYHGLQVPYFEFQDCDDKSQYLLTKFKEEEKRQCGTDHV